jgi:methylated-DNA-[protein]-cysteine S-methyltransferase
MTASSLPSSTVNPPFFVRLPSPIGRIEVRSDGIAITGLKIEKAGVLPLDAEAERPVEVLALATLQLVEYFAGERHDFELPVSLPGTQFQQDIWAGLQQLAWGGVSSYGELGLSTGRATAGRAVGGAVGANPIPIIVPCHRVLASNRTITGFSAGEGIPTKAWLLTHEGIEYRS